MHHAHSIFNASEWGVDMNVGYARTSTLDQIAGIEDQIAKLEAAGCGRIFQEQVSSVSQRDQLDAALEFLRAGDTLVITKVDRLARNLVQLRQIIDGLRDRGIAVRILDMGGQDVNSAGPLGTLFLNMLGAFAEFEREQMLQRQRIGIEKAKAQGKYTGRAPTAQAKADEVLRLIRDGMSYSETAKALGVSPASVGRIIKASKAG